MGSARSDGTDGVSDAADAQVLAAHKILIAGGFGAGKTTLVAAISEVRDSCTDPENDKGCDPALAQRAEDGKTYTYVSASMLAVGVVGLGVGAALWFTVGGKRMVPAEPTTTPSASQIVPAPQPSTS